MEQELLERRLARRAALDPWYQQLLKECEEAEPEFLRIRDSLSDADQETLDHYITLCEELGHRMACLALSLGSSEKKMDG